MQILYNAHITTNDLAQPAASAVAIDHGQIAAVGSDAEILDSFHSAQVKTDLRGKTIWPGLIDAHIHFEGYASNLDTINCETATRQECLNRVAARAETSPQGSWLLGYGWNQNSWPEGFGSCADLDGVSGAHPCYLTAKSYHAGWANSAALRLAGITATTPDPQDGVIVRDAKGSPTGILLESAMALVERVIPPLSVAESARLMLAAQTNLWKMGITGIHDFDRARCFSALQILDQAGQLRLRVLKSIPLELLDQAAALGLRSGFGSEFLRIGSVKLFTDGALGPHTAAMLQPYEDESQNTGLLFLDGEQIYEIGQKAVQSGLSLAIHAIGDRANHEVLNAYSQLRAFEQERGLKPARHRIEHVQALHAQDYDRLAGLDIIASVQPIHATSDMDMADRYWGARSQGAYAYGMLHRNGTRLAFGSDAPVEVPNPFWGIHAAVTRRRINGAPDELGWYLQHRIELAEALRAYTLGPAFAAGREHRQGKLASGYDADLIVLPENPAATPAQDLHRLAPCAVMVDGEWVLESE